VNRFIEVVKALKRRSRSVVACPQCRSLKIVKSTGMDGWMLPPLYLCADCGYTGRVVLEIQAEDARREGSEDEKNDTVR
jgi:DNA-directed RNA polymerase subunit RPC12/RpoP